MLVKKVLVAFRSYSTKPKRNYSSVRSGWDAVFGKYLLTTNIVSSGGLMAIGDIVQQEIEYQRNMLPKRYDYGRLTRMFMVGLLFGPLHHYVYGWLQNVLPKRDLKTITKKILFDQVVLSPVCILSFFYGMGAMEKKPLTAMNEEISKKFVEVYVMDWTVWPPSQFINFYFLPVKYQVVYINGVTMLYNVFLSYIKHREGAQEFSNKAAAASVSSSTTSL